MENSYVLQLQQQLFPDFYPCYCGCEACAPLQQFGPAMRPHYLIYVILSGKGVLHAGGSPVSLHPGDGFLIRPNQQVLYQADKDSPWTYLWVGFGGARSAEYLEAIGLRSEQQVFRTPDGESLREIVQEMQRHHTASTEHDFLLAGLLCRFFACLARSLTPPLSAVSKTDRENFYVRRAAAFVHCNYTNHITVSDMAKYVSLNRSYLFTLFQRVLHVSPQEFLTSVRLTHAKEQLTLTDATVAAIAQSVGYRDPLVFSKAFKHMTGLTPVQFRRQRQRETNDPA